MKIEELDERVELKLCPHCGRRADVYLYESVPGEWYHASIDCSVCPARSANIAGRSKKEVVEEAARRWNRRYDGPAKTSEGQCFWWAYEGIDDDKNSDILEKRVGGVRPLTCPCCGGNAIFLSDHWQEIQCKNEDCGHTAESDEYAGEVDGVLVERWNRRVSNKKEVPDGR